MVNALRVKSYPIKVNTVGADGMAIGEADSIPFAGRIISVDMIPHASAPATQDVFVYITKIDNKKQAIWMLF